MSQYNNVMIFCGSILENSGDNNRQEDYFDLQSVRLQTYLMIASFKNQEQAKSWVTIIIFFDSSTHTLTFVYLTALTLSQSFRFRNFTAEDS